MRARTRACVCAQLGMLVQGGVCTCAWTGCKCLGGGTLCVCMHSG